jgi:hypothetical protein
MCLYFIMFIVALRCIYIVALLDNLDVDCWSFWFTYLRVLYCVVVGCYVSTTIWILLICQLWCMLCLESYTDNFPILPGRVYWSLVQRDQREERSWATLTYAVYFFAVSPPLISIPYLSSKRDLQLYIFVKDVFIFASTISSWLECYFLWSVSFCCKQLSNVIVPGLSPCRTQATQS